MICRHSNIKNIFDKEKMIGGHKYIEFRKVCKDCLTTIDEKMIGAKFFYGTH